MSKSNTVNAEIRRRALDCKFLADQVIVLACFITAWLMAWLTAALYVMIAPRGRFQRLEGGRAMQMLSAPGKALASEAKPAFTPIPAGYEHTQGFRCVHCGRPSPQGNGIDQVLCLARAAKWTEHFHDGLYRFACPACTPEFS